MPLKCNENPAKVLAEMKRKMYLCDCRIECENAMVVGAILEFRYAKLWNEHRSVGRSVGRPVGCWVGWLACWSVGCLVRAKKKIVMLQWIHKKWMRKVKSAKLNECNVDLFGKLWKRKGNEENAWYWKQFARVCLYRCGRGCWMVMLLPYICVGVDVFMSVECISARFDSPKLIQPKQFHLKWQVLPFETKKRMYCDSVG